MTMSTSVGSVQLFQLKDFEKSLQLALQHGGWAQKAAQKVYAALGQPDPMLALSGMRLTNHGESRIPHCVKYDLGNGWRLVTQQNDKACGLLLVGKHDDMDRWLDAHKGSRFAVEDGRATFVPGLGPIREAQAVLPASEPLIDLLPNELADCVLEGIPYSISRRLSRLTARSSFEEIDAISTTIDDPDTSELVLCVFNQLRSGNVDGAIANARLRKGQIADFDELDEDLLLEVEDGREIRRLRIGSPEYEEWLRAFERRSAWYEWFLFLHPEQEKVVCAEYAGPAQLSGVSGSGKTCVAVRRALRLAAASEARVLLVTLNRSLAGLLRQLVDAVGADPALKNRIEVISFFELAQRLLFRFEPGHERIYSDVTWKLNEHVDEVFREYYRCWLNSNRAQVLFRVHQSLNSRGVNGEVYLREEFDWIRSAVTPEARLRYRELQRKGRRFPIPPEWRGDILEGLAGWEAKMEHVGVIDYLGLTSALARHMDSIAPEYTNVIVDEAQDFGTTELQLLRRLVARGPNDLFLCGDVAQTILPKHRVLADAGIQDPTRARIYQNYRNSREILRAAYELLQNNLHEDLLDTGNDLEILDPRHANFSGSVPLALYAGSLEEEIAYACTYAAGRIAQGTRTVCIAFAGFSTRDIQRFARRCGVRALDGNYDPHQEPLVFSDLEQTKGYEFDVLIIVQCKDGVLPPRDAPAEEAHRAACKLYVAMTRAKHELILSYHARVSRWITQVTQSIATAPWNEVEEYSPDYLLGTPEVLPEIEPRIASAPGGTLQMTGQDFLYTHAAIGLTAEAQQKLMEVVTGRERQRNGRRERWQNVGSLLEDLGTTGLYDAMIGKVVSSELRELAGLLGTPN